MVFKFLHNNFNVLNLEKSLKFYEDALGLKEVRRKVAGDGSFILVYLGDGQTPHQLELTWLRDRNRIIWARMSSILHLKLKTILLPIKNIRKWAVSCMKIQRWVFILLLILIIIGWKLFPNINF